MSYIQVILTEDGTEKIYNVPENWDAHVSPPLKTQAERDAFLKKLILALAASPKSGRVFKSPPKEGLYLELHFCTLRQPPPGRTPAYEVSMRVTNPDQLSEPRRLAMYVVLDSIKSGDQVRLNTVKSDLSLTALLQEKREEDEKKADAAKKPPVQATEVVRAEVVQAAPPDREEKYPSKRGHEVQPVSPASGVTSKKLRIDVGALGSQSESDSSLSSPINIKGLSQRVVDEDVIPRLLSELPATAKGVVKSMTSEFSQLLSSIHEEDKTLQALGEQSASRHLSRTLQGLALTPQRVQEWNRRYLAAIQEAVQEEVAAFKEEMQKTKAEHEEEVSAEKQKELASIMGILLNSYNVVHHNKPLKTEAEERERLAVEAREVKKEKEAQQRKLEQEKAERARVERMKKWNEQWKRTANPLEKAMNVVGDWVDEVAEGFTTAIVAITTSDEEKSPKRAVPKRNIEPFSRARNRDALLDEILPLLLTDPMVLPVELSPEFKTFQDFFNKYFPNSWGAVRKRNQAKLEARVRRKVDAFNSQTEAEWTKKLRAAEIRRVLTEMDAYREAQLVRVHTIRDYQEQVKREKAAFETALEIKKGDCQRELDNIILLEKHVAQRGRKAGISLGNAFLRERLKNKYDEFRSLAGPYGPERERIRREGWEKRIEAGLQACRAAHKPSEEGVCEAIRNDPQLQELIKEMEAEQEKLVRMEDEVVQAVKFVGAYEEVVEVQARLQEVMKAIGEISGNHQFQIGGADQWNQSVEDLRKLAFAQMWTLSDYKQQLLKCYDETGEGVAKGMLRTLELIDLPNIERIYFSAQVLDVQARLKALHIQPMTDKEIKALDNEKLQVLQAKLELLEAIQEAVCNHLPYWSQQVLGVSAPTVTYYHPVRGPSPLSVSDGIRDYNNAFITQSATIDDKLNLVKTTSDARLRKKNLFGGKPVMRSQVQQNFYQLLAKIDPKWSQAPEQKQVQDSSARVESISQLSQQVASFVPNNQVVAQPKAQHKSKPAKKKQVSLFQDKPGLPREAKREHRPRVPAVKRG